MFYERHTSSAINVSPARDSALKILGQYLTKLCPTNLIKCLSFAPILSVLYLILFSWVKVGEKKKMLSLKVLLICKICSETVLLGSEMIPLKGVGETFETNGLKMG